MHCSEMTVNIAKPEVLEWIWGGGVESGKHAVKSSGSRSKLFKNLGYK